MSEEEDRSEDLGFVFIANDILRKCRIEGDVQSLKECADSYFVAVYEGILGEKITGIVENAVSREQRIDNCDRVILTLSHDVLNVDLSHITGENIVNGDETTIQNLLEIFKELLDFILDVDDEVDSEKNDSNVLSSDHEIISHVLLEELGKDTENPLPSIIHCAESSSTDNSVIKEPELSSIPKCSDLRCLQGSDFEKNATYEINIEKKLPERQLPRSGMNISKSNERFNNDDFEDDVNERDEHKSGFTDLANVGTSVDSVVPKRLNGISESVDNFTDALKSVKLNSKVTSTGNFKGKHGNEEKSCVHKEQYGKKTQCSASKKFLHDSERLSSKETITIPTGSEREISLSRGAKDGYNEITRRMNGSQTIGEDSDKSRSLTRRKGHANKDENISGNRRLQSNLQNFSVQKKLSNEHAKDRIQGRHNENAESLLVEKPERILDKPLAVDRTREHVMSNKKFGANDLLEKNISRNGGTHNDINRITHREDIIGTHRAKISGTHRDNISTFDGASTGERFRKREKENKRPKSSVVVSEKTHGGIQNGTNAGAQEKNAMDNDVPKMIRRETCEATRHRTRSSESSGVFWDDQISPLDVSERLRNPSQGHAFDEVGLVKKSRDLETRRGVGTSKVASRDSSVVRHYHHHFHHGSSEDLIRDVDLNERSWKPEEREINSRIQQSRGLDIGKISPRDTTGSTHSISQKELTTKERDRKSGKKRSVQFDDHVDTFIVTNRLERLKQEMNMEDSRQHVRRSRIEMDYNRYLERLNREHQRMERALENHHQPKMKNKKVSPYGKKKRHVSRERVATNKRKARYPSSKARRSSSSSPVKKFQRNRKPAKQLEKGDVILPSLLDEFPFLYLSPHTLQKMRNRQTQQLLSWSKSSREMNKRQTKTQKVLEDAERRQQTLLKILRKDLQHNQRMREQKDRLQQERVIKSKLREKRHASARARRYYEEYQLRMRARMLKRRTKEEQIFKSLFEDGLEIQKQRVKELRSYAKEQREVRAVKQQNELESLENYYRDQYSILAEAIAEEKEALSIREKAQEKVIQQMQRNLREKLQKEVKEIQETIIRDDDDAYFRRLDAERLRKQLQMTAFQNLT
ncbi:centrosomal protein of 95 kDa-like [Xenia sp. Carnegie-2017]|uniref:centrosomal protein of 95 kDa-like n=1 Tax=Xenia sp. Carnegie-2017 TaxID=2897299 RepID=UPI001F04C5D5|nr:centrosomal protein of 95 kDa-like [Xenia sp. Carnegie-2017]